MGTLSEETVAHIHSAGPIAERKSVIGVRAASPMPFLHWTVIDSNPLSVPACVRAQVVPKGSWSEHCKRSKRRPCGRLIHVKRSQRGKYPSHHGSNALLHLGPVLRRKAGTEGGNDSGNVKRVEPGKHAAGVRDDGAGARGRNNAGAGGAGRGACGHVQCAKSGKHAVGVCDDGAGLRRELEGRKGL